MLCDGGDEERSKSLEHWAQSEWAFNWGESRDQSLLKEMRGERDGWAGQAGEFTSQQEWVEDSRVYIQVIALFRAAAFHVQVASTYAVSLRMLGIMTSLPPFPQLPFSWTVHYISCQNSQQLVYVC